MVLCKAVGIDKVAKAVQHGAGWKAGLVTGLGSTATRTITVDQEGRVSGSDRSGWFNGTYRGSATVNVPDEVARARAQQRADDIRAAADARSDAVIQTALKGTTIMPGNAASGFVYFERDKKQKAAVLQIILGSVSLEFPIGW